MPRPLTRSLLAASLVASALALSFAFAGPAETRAAEPEAEALLEVAREITSECDEYDPGQWLCSYQDDERYLHVNVNDLESSFGVMVGRNRFGVSAPVPAEPDLFGAMQDILRLILPGDAEAEGWLMEMNTGPQESGELVRGDWSLTWSAEMSNLVDGVANVTLDAFYFPTGAPTGPSSPAPAPSFAPPSFDPVELADSSLGEWTYEGTWTLTAQLNDAGLPPDPPIGTSRPATLAIECDRDHPCSVLLVIDGVPRTYEPQLVEPGRLRAERQHEPDDCPGPETETETLDVEHGDEAAVATLSTVSDPRSCAVENGTHYSVDSTFTFSGGLTRFVPPEEPADTDAPGPTAVPAPVEPGPISGPAVPTGDDEPFADTVPTIGEVSSDPLVLLQSGLLAGLLVFLMPFPSQLFNSTLETHENEVRRWFRLDRLGAVAGGIGVFWTSWPGVILFTVLAALLYGFLDPGFGVDLGSLATFLGMLLGIVLVTVAFAVPSMLAHRRHGERPSLKVVPLSLLIGVACVLLSRLTNFQPGYLYGLLIGLAFARELSEAEEGRATAVGAIAMLAMALVAWIGLGALPDGDGFGLIVGRTALAALMVAGLEGVVFGLLPMRFLPGEPLYAWNRLLWAALLGVGAFAFFHILINPASGYLSDTSRTPLLTVVALLVGFSLVSLVFWAWFRFRPNPAEAEAEA